MTNDENILQYYCTFKDMVNQSYSLKWMTEESKLVYKFCEELDSKEFNLKVALEEFDKIRTISLEGLIGIL